MIKNKSASVYFLPKSGILFLIFFFSIAVFLPSDFLFASRSSVETVEYVASNNQGVEQDTVTGKNYKFESDSGLQIIVTGDTISVFKKNGTPMGSNLHIIKRADADSACPADGFGKVVGKGRYFTIEQQTCSGWNFLNQFITFRCAKSSDTIWLHKFGVEFIDRRNPNNMQPDKIITQKEFGIIRFEQVNIDSLYKFIK